MNDNLKVAIVHDWLPIIGGAEGVLKEIIKVFPDADIFTLLNFLKEDEIKSLGIKNLKTSYLNKLPGIKRYYRKLLPLYPMAIEDFDLYEYDLIISSSAAISKGVITGGHQTHVSYVHSPARYAWDMTHKYLKQTNLDKGVKGFLTKFFLSNFRIWDYRTANGVDQFISNSNYIKKRIWKVYRREAEVIYPPVEIERFTLCEEKEDFYLTASRMVPYKRIDLIAEAFSKMPDKKLVICGDGPEMEKISHICKDCPNIQLVGYQTNETLKSYMQKAKAFVFAAEEDFGVVPVEAQACGTPVIAYGSGGALETVISVEQDPAHATGIFFLEQTSTSIENAVRRFEEMSDKINYKNCRKNAEKFSPEVFREKLKQLIARTVIKKYS